MRGLEYTCVLFAFIYSVGLNGYLFHGGRGRGGGFQTMALVAKVTARRVAQFSGFGFLGDGDNERCCPESRHLVEDMEEKNGKRVRPEMYRFRLRSVCS